VASFSILWWPKRIGQEHRPSEVVVEFAEPIVDPNLHINLFGLAILANIEWNE
jgi:hypothetical protein